MQILHHEHPRSAAQRVQHGREDLVLRGGATQETGHRGTQLVGDVPQLAERARC